MGIHLASTFLAANQLVTLDIDWKEGRPLITDLQIFDEVI